MPTKHVENMVNQYSEIDLLTIKMEGMKQALADDITQNKVDTQQIAQRTIAIRQLRDKIEELKKAQADSAKETEASVHSWKNFGKAIKTTFPTLSNLLKRFKSMIIMRSIRYLVRQIASGMSEGIQNVYQYSKAIGSSFAPAMDSAASALQQMKNSIGAAIAPAIQALIPIMQTVVNWFITAVNYLNQFFALLNGQATWTRALPATVGAFDKQTKAAKSAGAAMKDLLADWDELNIIQSQTGGGSGGGSAKAAEDYLKMFEEVSRFDNKVKDVVSFLKDNLKDVLISAGGVALAMKGWKLGSALVKWLPVLGTIMEGIAVGATVGVTVALTDMFGNAYIKSGSPAWLIADALTGAIGSSLAGELAGKIAGAAAGTVTRGFTLILSGAVNVKNAIEAMQQQKDAEAWALDALGSVEAGIGSALVAYGLTKSASIAIAAGSVVGLGTLAITIPVLMYIKKKASYRKMAYDAFNDTGKNGISIDSYVKALQGRLNVISADAQLVIDASVGLGENSEKFKENIDQIYRLNALLTSGESFTIEESETFKEAWHNVFEAMNELSTASFNTIYAGLSEVIASGSEELRKQALELRKQTIEIAGIVGGTRGKIEKKMDLLINTITSDTSTSEEIEDAIKEYDRLYKILAKTEDSGIKSLESVLKKGEGFDFTGEDNPIQGAIEFINTIAEQDFDPTIEKVNEALEAELKGIDEAREEAKLALEFGDITPETYKKFMDTLLGDETTFKKAADDKIKEINKLRDQTYDAVIRQAWKGYVNVKGNKDLKDAYIENVINPILDAAEAAGHDVSTWRNALIPTDFSEILDKSNIDKAKKEFYQQIYDEFGGVSDNDTIKMILNAEMNVQLKNGSDDIEQLFDETRIKKDSKLASEFVNSILQVEGFDYYSAITGMSSATGWSIADILDKIDISALDTEQLENLAEAIELIKSEFDFNNPVSPTDLSDAAEKTREMAAYYEDMSTRIKNALNSLDGVGFNFSTSGVAGAIAGIININKLTHASTGAVVKSGDLVMANENGDFEMMGRMGNQPVIANNQQIVAVSSQGIATANSGVESRLNTIAGLLNRMLQKEFLAKAVPSSGWGAHSRISSEQYSKVTG